MSAALGFDTSNYTTSCAWFDGTTGENFSRLLDVKPGELGLRQSDALFQHVKRLPELSDRLFARIDPSDLCAVGASSRPRAVDGSYMPCFLAGEGTARVLSDALQVPFRQFSHQQGHIAAALWSAGRLDLLRQTFLAWHLSGGTTELLLISSEQELLSAKIIGGTKDISAGQLIDRTGKLLGMNFPAGKALDAAAEFGKMDAFFRVRVDNSVFSLSGIQNQAECFYRRSGDINDTAAFVMSTVIYAIKEATRQAQRIYGELPVLFSGGVASNRQLRTALRDTEALFAEPAYSTDNAMGIAILTYLQEN